MNEKEIKKLLALNAITYPNFFKDRKEQETALLAATWLDILGEYPNELIEPVFKECLKTCKYPVTIADIFECLHKIERAAGRTTDELWQEFISAAYKASRLAEGFSYNGPDKKDPYITQGEGRRREVKAIFEGLDDKIKIYVGNAKRLIDFGDMDSEHLEQIIFPAFRRSMESIDNRREVLDTTSPTMLNMAGGGTGLETKFLSVLAGGKDRRATK